MSNPYDDDLKLAHELADKADEITSKWFRSSKLKVKTKPDMTPVTEADREAEQMIVKELADKRPLDKILGEEFGGVDYSKRRWIIDPIDGTKNYARGIPVYATLIALEADGQMVVAVVSAPQMSRRWWASKGGGAYANGEPIHVSAIHQLNNAFLIYGSLNYWQRAEKMKAFWRLHNSCGRQRSFGDFWMYMLVAEGAADIAVEPTGTKIWDIAAPALIAQEAGATITNLSGRSEHDGSLIVANSHLHKEVLTLLNPKQ